MASLEPEDTRARAQSAMVELSLEFITQHASSTLDSPVLSLYLALLSAGFSLAHEV